MHRSNTQGLAVPPAGAQSSPLRRQTRAEKPRWDATNYTLWWGHTVVKQFRGMAPAQEAILAAFEEAGWAACVPVSLLRGNRRDRKHWLRDTVKNLNRSVGPYLHFSQERSGTRLRWRLLQGAAGDPACAT